MKQEHKLEQSESGQTSLVSILDLFYEIWRLKIFVVVVTIAFSTIGVFFALSLPNLYQANVITVPDEGAVNQFGGQNRSLGGLAGLAQLGMGVQTVDKVSIALEIAKSREFLVNFIERHDLLPELMAVKEWDAVSKELILDSSVYNSKTKEWVRNVSAPFQQKPSPSEYVPIMRQHFSIVRDTSVGTYTFIVEHQSPEVAYRWVKLLVKDLNDVVRARYIADAERSLEYLYAELEKTSVQSAQQAFFQMVEQQIQTKMLANTRPDYVFSIIDPAAIPEFKVAPSRAVICIIFALFGAFLAVAIVWIRFFVRLSK